MMALTTFDLAALLLIFACVVISALRGLMGEVIAFMGWLVALVLARIFAVPVSDVVFASMNPRPMAVVCAFVLVYVIARIAVILLHQLLDLIVKKAKLSRINRLLGALLGATKGVLVVSLVVLACSFSDLPKNEEWRNAVTAPFFEDLALLEKDYLPDFLAQQVVFPAHDDVQVAPKSPTATSAPQPQILKSKE